MAYTNIDDPSAHFQAVLWTGDGLDNKQITNDGNSDLQPDWVWLKDRTQAESNALFDSSRGASVRLQSNNTSAESTETATLKSFTTDGFTVGTSGSVNNGTNPDQYVAWQWKCNGGTTSSNTDGTVTSTVQVNQDAGFSIVTWTVGLASGNHSVGHGLGVKPAVFITKSRGSTSFWTLWHQGLAGDTSYVRLDAATQELTYSDIWGDGITSSVFGYNYPATVYVQPYVAYCFAEKQGFSKFNNYVGNGVANNGPFVYLGFKPRFIMIKSTTATGSHVIWDSKRSPFNGMDDYLVAAEADAEGTNGIFTIDAVSNGFKIRNTGANNGLNQSGTKYIYYAFAENPFVTSTGIPTTAR